MAAKFLTPSNLMTAIRAGLLDGVINAIATGADIEEADMHGFTDPCALPALRAIWRLFANY